MRGEHEKQPVYEAKISGKLVEVVDTHTYNNGMKIQVKYTVSGQERWYDKTDFDRIFQEVK